MPRQAHLSGGQARGRLHRGQQPEPARVCIGRDLAQLVRVHADQGVKDLAGVVEARLGRPEQGRLPGRPQSRVGSPAGQGPLNGQCPLDGHRLPGGP